MFVGLDFSCFGIMNSDWMYTLMNCSAVITRFDAAEVAAEVEHAREVEKQMAKDSYFDTIATRLQSCIL